jgi:hypothetical protein
VNTGLAYLRRSLKVPDPNFDPERCRLELQPQNLLSGNRNLNTNTRDLLCGNGNLRILDAHLSPGNRNWSCYNTSLILRNTDLLLKSTNLVLRNTDFVSGKSVFAWYKSGLHLLQDDLRFSQCRFDSAQHRFGLPE